MEQTAAKNGLLYVAEMDGRHVYEAESIVRVEARSNYSFIHFKNRSSVLVVCKVLGWIESQLPDDMFLRVHRSHLVNKAFISGHDADQGDSVELVTGERVPVSRRRRIVLKQQQR